MTDDVARGAPAGVPRRGPAATPRGAAAPGPLVIDEVTPEDRSERNLSSMDMSEGARVLAPGAPPSPGTRAAGDRAPPAGSARRWGGGTPRPAIDLRPLADRGHQRGGAAGRQPAGARVLGWTSRSSDLWRPIAVLLSPMLLWLVREQFSQRAILVTDTAVLEVPRRGEPQRLQFSAVQRVRRDLLTGGVVLTGKLSVRSACRRAWSTARARRSRRSARAPCAARPSGPTTRCASWAELAAALVRGHSDRNGDSRRAASHSDSNDTWSSGAGEWWCRGSGRPRAGARL